MLLALNTLIAKGTATGKILELPNSPNVMVSGAATLRTRPFPLDNPLAGAILGGSWG
jgi:hypothetical protein